MRACHSADSHSIFEETDIMAHALVRSAFVGLVALALTVSVGCTRWIDIMPSAMASQGSLPQSIANNERVPLVIEGFRLVQNGAAQNPSLAMERRVLDQMQETRLFSTLVPFGGNSSLLGDKVITARLTFNETIDPHAGEAAWKGFVIGASMFLLSSAIELDYDYAAQATLELERWDGQVKQYAARSAGTAHYNLFGATPIMIDELKGQVTEACLADLMEQLVRDTNFYVASSTPLPDAPLRIITVKARKPATAAPALSVIPVSIVPAP
jgi:hypothetical protein